MINKLFSIKNLISILIIFALSSLIFAQKLERKGTLGIQMKATSDNSSIEVLEVFKDTTASSLGILKNDIILSINNQKYGDVTSLVNEVRKWRAGEAVSIEVKRGNQLKKLSGKVVGKPLETSSFGKVIYGHVDYDGGKLRSILQVPHNVKNPPVMLFLPGVGCASYDFYINPKSTVKLLIESFVEKGIAVYRVEKPGMGDSSGTKHCLEMDFDYEVKAFETALKKLKTIDEIDKENIFLFGESLGSVSAPLIASKNKVQGIVAWGGIPSTWFEYYLKLQRKQKTLLGIDYAKMDSDFRKILPFFYDYLINKKSPNELAKNPDYSELVKRHFRNDTWHGLHHYSYFQNLNDKDVLTAYKNANCPVLSIAGEHDIHAAGTDWAEIITDAVNYYRPNQAKSVIIPKTTHHYYKVPSITEYNKLRRSRKITSDYMANNFSKEIAVAVDTWIESRM